MKELVSKVRLAAVENAFASTMASLALLTLSCTPIAAALKPSVDKKAELMQLTPYLQWAAYQGDRSSIESYAAALDSASDGTSLLQLADMLWKGSPPERELALSVYERAAENGRTVAWVKLAQFYTNGNGVTADPHKAISYYRLGIAAGRTDALVGLGKAFAERRFGRLGTRAEGVALIRQALDLGQPQAAALLGEFEIMGYGMPRNVGRGLAFLKSSWEQGNVKAGLQLVSLYRDGRKDVLKPDRMLAESYFRRLSDQLDPEERAIQRLMLDAPSLHRRGDLASIAGRIRNLADARRPAVVRKLRVLNPNAYVFLVQTRLSELSLYRGRATGRLSRNTVKAIYRYCVQNADVAHCRKGPLTASVAETLSAAF